MRAHRLRKTRSDPMASVVGTILSTAPASGPDEELTKNVAAIAYAGKLLSVVVVPCPLRPLTARNLPRGGRHREFQSVHERELR